VRSWGLRLRISVICTLTLPISVVEAGIFEVRVHYLVPDELGAMLRGGTGFGNFGGILPLGWWDEGSVMFDCAEGMDRQTEVKTRSRNRRRVWVGCTSLGCGVLCRMLSDRVLWEEGAGLRLEKSWVRARDVYMCVVAKAWFSGWEREGVRDYSEICW